MLVNLRQGIVSTQNTPGFLTFVSDGVNINTGSAPTIITFAYGSNDYLFTEAEDISPAWTGPFSVGTDYWLYWDIDLFTGLRTFGKTLTDPFPASMNNGVGKTLPSNPISDQHWFDTSVNKYKVWTGSKWVEKIRVFAGKIASGSVLTTYAIGTQVGIAQQRRSGHLLFDASGQPIRVADRLGRGYFITTESLMNSQEDRTNSYKLESTQNVGKAVEPIPQYYCLCWKGPQQLGLASYTDVNNFCVGISANVMGVDEVSTFITDGFITNYNNWNFPDKPGTSLWVGATGEITTDVPKIWSMQEIGHVVSPDTIFIDLYRQILIDPLPYPTPTPSPTMTQTPTPSVTQTITPTITPTFTPLPSPTPTSTQTNTTTMTPSITAGVSPTVTQTPTRTPILTPSVTPTMTPSAAIGFDVIAQSNTLGVAMLRHDGNTKTELAAATVNGLGLGPMDVRNITSDQTTVFAADHAAAHITCFLYDGTDTLRVNGSYAITNPYDVKYDGANNVLHVTGSIDFIQALSITYDINNGVTLAPVSTISNLGDFTFNSPAKAIYRFPNNRIFGVTDTEAFVMSYNPSTHVYTILTYEDFSSNLNVSATQYKFGWHIKNFIPDGTKRNMIVDSAVDYTEASPNILIYDTADDSITYFNTPTGDTIPVMLANRITFASDGQSILFAPNWSGNVLVWTYSAGTFTLTDTISSSNFQYSHMFYDDNDGTERGWVMQQFLDFILEKSGGSYSNIAPTDDVFHSELASFSTPPLIDSAEFLKPMIQVTPTPSGP